MEENSLLAFVFTDIVNSTGLWEADREAMGRALEQHDQILDLLFAEFGGEIFKRVGDAYCVVFGNPVDAARSAIAIQNAIASAEWPEGATVRIRTSIHVGPVISREGDFYGPTVNRVARLLGECHQDQILISGAAHSLIQDSNGPAFATRFVGRRRLRGLSEALEIHELLFREVAQMADSGARSDLPVRYVGNRVDAGRPFVGREKELVELRSKLDDPRVRVLTVAGMGGMGKTRISCRIAELCAPQYRDGAQIVDCGSLTDRQSLVAALFASADFEPEFATEPQLIQAFRDREALVVLDCFEGHIDDAELVQNVVEACPKVRFIVSSRITLALHSEFVYELAGMREDRDYRTNEAFALFSQVVSQVAPSQVPNSSTRGIALEICNLLEGVPLAITLAAARLRHLGYEEILEQLKSNRLKPLVDGRDAESRHSTLQRVIDDSMKLLDRRYRDCLGMLACFEGGFTLADANAICSAPNVDVSEAISMLRDHSLLQAKSEHSKTRYRILDSIREYLDAQGMTPADVRMRHAEHYSTIAQKISELFRQGRWEQGNGSLFREIGNIRRALETAVIAKNVTTIRALCESIPRSLLEAGMYAQFERFAEIGLSMAAQNDDVSLRLSLLGLRGELSRRRGDIEESNRLWQERARLAQETGSAKDRVDALLDLADLFKSDGFEAKAADLLEDGYREAIAHGLRGFESTALAFMAMNAMEIGDEFKAKSLASQAMQVTIPPEDQTYMPYVFRSVAKVLKKCGESDSARSALLQMLQISNEMSQIQSIANALHDLAVLMETIGSIEEAVELLVAAADFSKDCAVSVRKNVRSTMNRFRTEYRTPELESAWIKATATDSKRVIRRVLAGA